MADDDDEYDDEFEPPRVRPARIFWASVFSVVGVVMMALSWFAVRDLKQAPEPQGAAAAFGQWIAPIVAWIGFALFAIMATVATVTLVTALLEARAARRGPPG